MKTCAKCEVKKPKRDFAEDKSRIDGRRYWCRSCVRQKWYQGKGRWKKTLTAIRSVAKREGYAPCHASEDEIRAAFVGVRETCGVPEEDLKRRLCLDHDHTTGAFRGWLCSRCNRALGFVLDSPERLRKLADYLEK